MALLSRCHLIHKQHTCVVCGCVFGYAFAEGDWRTPLMTQTFRPRDSIRLHPCPDCGHYQPEMAMWFKVGHPLLALLALVASLGLAGLMFTNGGVNAILAAQIGTGLFFALGLFHMLIALHDPNGDMAANRETARAQLASGDLTRIRPGSRDSRQPMPRHLGWLHGPGFLLLFAAPGCFVAAILQLADLPPLASHPQLTPSILSPGDRVEFVVPNQLQGITGAMWRGTPTVRVQNARALGIDETLVATGSQQQWGDKFQTKSYSGNAPLKPRISFELPRNEKLAGQTLYLAITLPLTYPVSGSSSAAPFLTNYFQNETATLHATLEVRLADPKVVQANQQAGRLGLAGMAGSTLGAFWLTGLAWMLVFRSSRHEAVPDPAEALAEPDGALAPSAFQATPEVPVDFDRSHWGKRRLR
ncbi:MAG: hypothetical protein U0840_30600 [Gemmataceae bacterium]